MAFPVCPNCKGNAVYRVYRPGMLAALLRVVAVHSFCCVSCEHRFRAFQWGWRGRSAGQERRQFDRIMVRFAVAFSSEHLQGKGTVINLSMDGCLIETDTMAPADTLLNLKLFASGQDMPVEIAGIVRSVDGKRLGVKFLRVRSQDPLAQFLRQP